MQNKVEVAAETRKSPTEILKENPRLRALFQVVPQEVTTSQIEQIRKSPVFLRSSSRGDSPLLGTISPSINPK